MVTPQRYDSAESCAIALNPQSIQAYFEKVRYLSQSGIPFPVDLDDVWPLVYAQKGKAVAALRKLFHEGIDFESFSQTGKREIGATVVHNFKLSVACMEFFIARKVREVFDVYRKVFHHVVGTAVHVPQVGVIAKLEKLEHTLALMKKESTRQFKMRREQFWHNAKVRTENRQHYKHQQERQELFDLFERYRKVEYWSSGNSILDSIIFWAESKYNLHLKRLPRGEGEHVFDAAIKAGKGYVISEVIRLHMHKPLI